ncbi:hypothetical protein D9613_000577 [Agrocybe pediades]|uniref:Amidohydrolase 3 domain-containing protein n=1 Tax=Agrocybe pediades TaxID=84607 RepID=A0A8H4QZS3_9AGAR|nr:hypothetical protein D9613_000577 [Agrocybe pediades]
MPSNVSEGGDGGEDKKKKSDEAKLRGRSGNNWLILFATVAIALGSFLLTNKRGNTLPKTYAICSKDSDKVYVVDDRNLQTQCVVVDSVLIADTGSLGSIREKWGDIQIRYLPEGAVVLPGLSDSHGHVLEYGAAQQLPLEGAKSPQDVVARVREYILATPEILEDKSQVIFGGGWDHTAWSSTGWPTAADLDADSVVRGRPVILQSKDCHALWVSSKAIKDSLPLPETIEGGVIVRDESGDPTGLFLDNAQDLLKQPELTEAELLRRFNVAVRDAHRYGLTSVHDAGLDPMSLAFFKRQAKKGTLPIRIYGMSYFDPHAPYWGNVTRPLIATGNGRLTTRSVKIFADGALRTGGSALHEVYHDNPKTRGFMRLEPEILFDVIPKFVKDGWQVNVHAIGDRANGIVLDAFEASLVGADVGALRPRLEHAQMMTKEDMTRLGKLGVIASVQPTHAISDMWYAEDRLGPERVKSLYAFRSIVDSGARITLGSDFPVETMDPLSGFYAAVTRKSPDGKSPHGPGGWFPEQKLTRREALRGMTIDPAYASFTESILGSLEIGKRADFTVLSQDIMTVPEDQILSTRVIATVIDGKPVFGDI